MLSHIYVFRIYMKLFARHRSLSTSLKPYQRLFFFFLFSFFSRLFGREMLCRLSYFSCAPMCSLTRPSNKPMVVANVFFFSSSSLLFEPCARNAPAHSQCTGYAEWNANKTHRPYDWPDFVPENSVSAALTSIYECIEARYPCWRWFEESLINVHNGVASIESNLRRNWQCYDCRSDPNIFKAEREEISNRCLLDKPITVNSFSEPESPLMMGTSASASMRCKTADRKKKEESEPSNHVILLCRTQIFKCF